MLGMGVWWLCNHCEAAAWTALALMVFVLWVIANYNRIRP